MINLESFKKNMHMQTSVPHTCLKNSLRFFPIFTYEEKYFDIIPGLGSNWRRLTRAHSFIQYGPDSQTHFDHVKGLYVQFSVMVNDWS